MSHLEELIYQYSNGEDILSEEKQLKGLAANIHDIWTEFMSEISAATTE